MFRHGHYKQYVTDWATRLTKSGPSWRAGEESSERHEVSFFPTSQKSSPHDFQCCERTISTEMQTEGAPAGF